MAKLTDKQERFVQELIKGKSQRESYRRAYPKSLNWKDKTIDQAASRLLKNSKVDARYNEIHNRLIKEAEDESIFEAKDVLREVARIAFANVTDYANIVTISNKKQACTDEYRQIVVLKDTVNLNKSQSAPIKSIKQGRYGIEIELYPKDKSLEMLGKHLKLFTDSFEVLNKIENPYEGLTTEELKKLAGVE